MKLLKWILRRLYPNTSKSSPPSENVRVIKNSDAVVLFLRPKNEMFLVVFKSGAAYVYDVPEKLALLLIRAPDSVSAGTLFHYTIRIHPTVYPYTPLDGKLTKQIIKRFELQPYIKPASPEAGP